MAPAGRALAVLALGAAGLLLRPSQATALLQQGCGLSGSSALAAEPCNGEEDGFGGRCPYLVDGAWAAGARWSCAQWCELHGSACFMAVQSDQCAANTFDEATCDDLHSDAAVCACEGLLAPPAAAGSPPRRRQRVRLGNVATPAPEVAQIGFTTTTEQYLFDGGSPDGQATCGAGTTEAVSDGTADRPFCSWRSQCTWDAAAMAECATALCQAGGFAAGVFVSASNDPCTMSFAPNTGSDWFWLLDDDEVKYTLAKMDAQVTACCGSATTTVISTAMTPAPTNAPTSAPTSAPTNAPTTTTFISTEVTPAPTNGPFTTTAMTPVPTPAPTTTEMTPSPTSAPVATPAPTPDSNVFITTTRASTTQELGTEPVDQTTETVTSLTDTPVSVTAATSTALGGTTILDPDASASTETTTVGRTYSTTYGLQSSTTLDPIATATLSTMGSTVTTTPTTTQTLKCYDAPSVLHAPDTSTCAGTPDGSACDVQCGDGYVMTGVAACRGGAWDVTGRCVPSGTQATTLSVAEVIMRLSASNGYEWATEHQAEIEAAIEATLGTLDFLVDIFPVSSRRLTGGSQDISQADEFDIVVTVVVEGAAGGEEQAAYDIWSSLAGGFVGSLTSVLDSAGEPVPGGLRLETIGEPVVIPEYEMPLKSWIAGAWGSCSAACGQGTEARDVFCSVGVQSTCERAGVGPMLAAARECEQFVQCSFDLLCPLGRDTSLGCGAQLALIVACVALAGLCVLACACARLYAMSRVSATGHVSMLGGIQAKYTIEKRRQQQQLQQGNQPDLEHGSVSLKADGGKTHIVWEVDMDKVQEVLSPSASVVDPLGAHSPAARRRGSGLLRKWSRVSGGSMSHTPSRASGGSGDEELARRMRHWLSEQEVDEDELDDRIEAALLQARRSALSLVDPSGSLGPGAVAHRLSTEAAQAALAVPGGEAGQPRDVFAAYSDRQRVEYFSRTHMRWVPGVVGVSIHRGRGRTTAPSVRYAVELSRGQKRQRVTLDQLRPPLREGERVEVFSRRQGAFLAATIGGAHASTATLGYKVLLAGTALPVPGVPASHLRRVFVAGDAVLVYRGPAAGWASAEVVAEPVAGGKQAALLMPDFVGGGGWLEAGVQIVPNRSGKRVNSMGSIGSMGSMPPSMRTVDSAADSPDSPVYARRSSAGSIWKLPSRRKSTESVRGSPSRRKSTDSVRESPSRRSSGSNVRGSPSRRDSTDSVRGSPSRRSSGSNVRGGPAAAGGTAGPPLPRLLSRGRLPDLKPEPLLPDGAAGPKAAAGAAPAPSEAGAGAPQSPAPAQPGAAAAGGGGARAGAPAVLRVTVVGARGLRNADWLGKSDPYCVCEVRGKSGGKCRFQTPVIDNCLEPVWDHVGEVADFGAGDELLFTVMDQDLGGCAELLGKAVLTSAQFDSAGFDGELPLFEAGKGGASVHVRVHPAATHVPDPWVWVAVLAVGGHHQPDRQPEWFPSFLIRSRPKGAKQDLERNGSLVSI